MRASFTWLPTADDDTSRRECRFCFFLRVLVGVTLALGVPGCGVDHVAASTVVCGGD